MRMRLSEAQPEWVRDMRSGGRIGFTFGCLWHNGNGHRLAVYFSRPPDADTCAVTASDAVRPVPHSGSDWDTLTVDGHLRDGDVCHHVVDGYILTA